MEEKEIKVKLGLTLLKLRTEKKPFSRKAGTNGGFT